MRKLLVLGAALAIAGSAYAAPNIVNVSQKGSILVFPDIRVQQRDIGDGFFANDFNTLVRINNDGPAYVRVKCFWMDRNKHRLDFSFTMTPFQPVWFDARNGDGSTPVTPYPSQPANGTIDTEPVGVGLLACWAVDIEEMNQLKYNHLYGTATVVGEWDSVAYEYSAYAFYAQVPGLDGTTVVGTGGDINMNGFYYDQCPEYQTGTFTPQTCVLDGAVYRETRLAFASCQLDFTQDWAYINTKMVFEVWNEYENKFTGAFDCSNSYHEVYLIDDEAEFHVPISGASIFSTAAIGTCGARYRMTGDKSDRCDFLLGAGARKVGMLGVQSTHLTTPGGEALVGNTLTNAGKIAGRILWDAKLNPTPDGKIR